MRFKTIIGVIFVSLSPMLLAQDESGEDGKQVENLLSYQKDFLNLSVEKRREYLEHQREASRLFSEKRILETLESLRLAEKAFADSPELWNLRGSCYVEFRAFDKALKCFEKAKEMAAENHSVLFNIGEVYFVSRDWQKAHDIFEALLKELPPERQGLNRITEFKLLLCKLKLGDEDEARILANKYDYLDDSPYHYYAKAALAYHAGDLQKAEQATARAARIFRSAAVLAPWYDTLVEFGYIKSFYGDGDGNDN